MSGRVRQPREEPIDTASTAALTLTGERTLPGIASENYWFRRHEAAYSYLAGRLAGDVLLEVGAGEGYGARLLSGRYRLTCALDYDAATADHLGRAHPGLRACRANLAALPFRTGCTDALVSLQVIEHVWHPAQFLAECRRVLRPDGLLALSTPNRLTFSPGLARGQKPENPFHVREFDAEELIALVAGHGFAVSELLGLRAGSRLARLDRRHGGLVAAQLRTPPSGWSPELAADVGSVTAADFAVGPGDPGAGLDLIVLARPA
ncbi:MAG TPA: methyltransferase domain-containing protein [Jatrophihabitans sp.]|nr:methyltransferase domain-containing protein [Jatrophihabitans sp.]